MEPNNIQSASQAQSKPKVTARDFFLHLGFIAALYTWIGVFISFVFSIINTIYPDRQYNYYDPYGSGMRWSVSMLIVVTPLMLYLLKRIYAHITADPARKDLWVRRWGLYLTFTLSVIMLAVDLVYLINKFLGGEISARFTWKALTVIVVGALVWLFTRRELHDSLASKPKLAKGLGWSLIGVVVLLLVVGFSYIGSPTLLRNIRDDNQREADLNNLKYRITTYYQSKDAKLPQTLEEMTIGDIYSEKLPVDPATEMPYEYKVLAPKVVVGQKDPYPTFALCATFKEDGKIDERVQNAGGRGGMDISVSAPSMPYPYGNETNFSDHPEGYHCFETSIDPMRYKPYYPPQTMEAGVKVY